MKTELAVFDMAGTTVYDDQFVHQVLQNTLADHGTSTSMAEINEVMGWSKPVAIATLIEQKEGVHPQQSLVSKIHQKFEENMRLFYQNDPVVKENDGASSIFSKLKQAGIKVTIDTGFSRIIADTIIDRLGWERDGLIDYSVTSDEVDQGRPHPDMIYKIMERYSIEDSQLVIKIGDTASDIQQGIAAGCGKVVGITTGAFSREQLENERPTHIISHLSELSAVLQLG